jgi:HlyD family secretion protein
VARGQADYDAAQKRREGAPQLAALAAQAKGLEAQIAQAKADLGRAQELQSSGVQTAQQLEREKTLLAGLQAQLEANLAQQRDVRIGLDADAARAQAGVATLSARFSDAEVRAPMDGVVLVRRVEQGETVLLSQPLFRVGDLSHLQVEAQVDEADVAQVRPGTSAAVRLPAFEDRLVRAHVARIAPEADRERKSFGVELELESPPPGLRPGMTVEVNLLVRRHDGVLLAPAQAVVEGALLLLEGGRVQRRPVQAGIRDLSRVEVSGAVHEGDLALLTPLAEGARARPRIEKLPAARPPPPSEAGLTER